jgi:histidine triad (HIT) family protein
MTPTSPLDTDPDCLFCRIVAGEIPSRQVYADDVAVAFLDVAPWQRGHTLVVPRRHADGLNLLSSAKAVAGQEIFHLHVHLVPRYADRPGLSGLIGSERGDDTDLDAVHAAITA